MGAIPGTDENDPRAPLAGAPSAPRPRAAPGRTVHMVGNAHLDVVWLWPWQEGYQEARATFWSAVHRMDENPDFVFTCNQVVLLAWVEEADPELFARIRERVAEGRWQMTGGWWVEPDGNMPGAESFVRQGLYGQRYLMDRFGVTGTVGMNVDPFGHHAMLPQVLRGQGMDSYCFTRPGPHELTLPGTAFWWESPDGSRVLAYRIPFAYSCPPGDTGEHLDLALGHLDPGLGDAMVFYGVGNHGGGPTRANLESIRRYDAMGTYGRLLLSHPRRYLDGLLADGGGAELPVWRRDLQVHAPGCLSAHSGVKAWQRRAQAAVLAAERWAAVGALTQGLPYPRDDLGRAWRQVLFNQFHDVLPGSAIEQAYDDVRDQLGEAVAIASRITARVHSTLARQVDVPLVEGTQPVLVFNPHPWPVTAAVELQHGYGWQPGTVRVVDAAGAVTASQRTQPVATTEDRIATATAFEAEVPALGYRLYRLEPGTAAVRTALRADGRVLENDVLRAEVDPGTGWLTSLLDKRTGVDLVAGARGEHTQVCEDPSDTWGHRVVSYAWPGAPMRTTRVVLREDGPLRARLRVERAWGRSTLVEELVLGRRSDHLEVRVTLDWRERAHLLKLRAPVALDGPVGTWEVPFGAIQRPVDGAEAPAQSWVDLTGTVGGRPAGLAVVNDAKHGCDTSPADEAGGASIGITAVRSPVYSWHDPRPLDPEGVYSYQDQGVQAFRYLLVPHAGDWRGADLFRRAAELGSPVRAMLEGPHSGSLPGALGFADDGGGPVVVSAVKGSEDDAAGAGPGEPDLVVRAYESTGRPARARIGLPLVGRIIEADFGPSQIRTFRVPRDGGDVVEVDLVEWESEEHPRGAVASGDLPRAVPSEDGGPGQGGDADASDAVTPAEQMGPAPDD